MNQKRKKINHSVGWLLTIMLLLTMVIGCSVPPKTENQAVVTTVAVTATTEAQTVAATEAEAVTAEAEDIDEEGSYTSKEDVALYIYTYGKLPENFITKKEAEKAGWNSKEGNLWEVAPGKSIGGSHFGNYEGQLPEKKGRNYFECDINYQGGYRQGERIIYSDDGLVYYTGDHYKTFEQLYP